jgi:hypothetical protein
MTSVLAPSAAAVAALRAPQGVPGLAQLPGPRITFRSLLLRDEAPRALQPPTERPTPVPHWLSHAQHSDAVPASSSRRTLYVDRTPASLPPPGSRLDEDDPLDSQQRRRQGFAPPDSLFGPAPPATPDSHAVAAPSASTAWKMGTAASLEDLLPALVRRIAWSGDRHRGTVRLELGAGELAGGTLLVHAEDGRVRVHLDVPPGVDTRQWEQRIRDRLAARGVATDIVEVA